jgi:hypothetical protein
VLMILSMPSSTSMAQDPGEGVFFPETGHWVYGPFFQFYNAVNNPLLIFGYPITDQFTDPTNGTLTQYFQHVRFDLVKSQDVVAIEIAPLGTLLYEEDLPSAAVPITNSDCQFFPATQKSVCFAFLQFYNKHQGEQFFGNPISEIVEVNDQFVQYFERARMEWHANRLSGERVVLSDLGRIYYDTRVGNPARLSPSPGSNILQLPIKIHTNAFISNPVAAAETQQTLFVVVQDQFFNPVSGAMVSATLNLPDGQKDVYRLQPTNEMGFCELNFTTGPLPINEVISIDVNVLFQDQEAHARSWFRSWW